MEIVFHKKRLFCRYEIDYLATYNFSICIHLYISAESIVSACNQGLPLNGMRQTRSANSSVCTAVLCIKNSTNTYSNHIRNYKLWIGFLCHTNKYQYYLHIGEV